MTTMLNAALALASKGLAVFPVTPTTKDKPLIRAWQKNATNDADQVRSWWAQWPGANVGVCCGLSEIVVVDVDMPDGPATWAALCEEHGITTETVTASTPSGGIHYYYKAPAGAQLRNTARRLGAGLDTRAGPGYVLAPPSSNGHAAYTWGPGAEIAPLPNALQDLLQRSQQPTPKQPRASSREHDLSPYVQAAIDAEIDQVRRAATGQRNDQLNRSAYALGQLVGALWAKLDRLTAERELTDAAIAAGLDGDPNCGLAGIAKTLQSGLESGMANPRPEPEDRRAPIAAYEKADSQQPEAGGAQLAEDTSYLLYYGPDDLGNACCVRREVQDRIVYTPTHGWLYYNGRYWDDRLAELYLGRRILDTLKKRQHAGVEHQRQDIMRAATPSAHHMGACKIVLANLMAVDIGDFDANPELLNCQNGTVNLRTGELLPHDKGQRFTYCLPVNYDPNARSDEWAPFLYDAVGGDELVDYLQMAVGYSLTGHTREECLFYVHGPLRAGKGTFIETILAMLGKDPIATQADFTTFTKGRDQDSQNFDLAGLKPCRFVAASESTKYSQINTARLKSMTGGDEVRCAHKHKPFFTYRPQFKIWLVSNHPPNIDVDDDAAWYRLKVIPFPNSYAGREDKLLKQRLREPESLRGVLAWAVAGAREWFSSDDGLQTPDAVEQTTKHAREEMDFVAQWLTECVNSKEKAKLDTARFVSNASLHGSYKAWCDENGVKPKSLRGLTQSLNAKGYRAGEAKWNQITEKTERGCLGVLLK